MVEVVDTTTLQLTRVVPVGGRYGPFGVEVDEAARLAYVSGGDDGALAVIDLVTFEVVELIAARAEPWYGLTAVDPVAGTLYVVTFDGSVTVMPGR
jgi:DNA-binding beta-propeller fold protein YncE